MTHHLAPIDIDRACLAPVAGIEPDLQFVRLSDLVIEDYQRVTSEAAGQALIAKIAERWSWDRCGAIIVRPCRVDGAAKLAVVDGQHRAIAAMTRGDISAVPAVIIAAEDARDAARSFIGLNLDRRNLSAPAVFWAEVEAGHPDARAILDAADKARVTILRTVAPAAACAVGETSSVGALRNIHRAKGPAGLARALKIAVAARLAPVKSWHLEAIALALWEPELKGRALDADLAEAMRLHEDAIEDAAALAALDTGQPKKRCAAIELVNLAERGRA